MKFKDLSEMTSYFYMEFEKLGEVGECVGKRFTKKARKFLTRPFLKIGKKKVRELIKENSVILRPVKVPAVPAPDKKPGNLPVINKTDNLSAADKEPVILSDKEV